MKIAIMTVFVVLLTMFVVFAGELEQGQTVFQARCSACHQLPDPGMLKPDQWRRLLDTKQKLMEKAGMPMLTPEEYKDLLAYLQKSARQ